MNQCNLINKRLLLNFNFICFKSNQQNFMEKLLFGKKQKSEKLGNISPEKYGKGAYSELTYTPSKLADNVLFRQASNLKKIEQESSKNRQFQAENTILNDQITYLRKERDAIAGSLNEIIGMYKGIIAEMQTKNQKRLKEYQTKWSQQIQKFIKEKQEEAKYFQSEKQILQERIQELQAYIQNLKDELQESRNSFADLSRKHQSLENCKKNLEEKLAANQKKAEEDAKKAKSEYDSLKKQYMHAEVQWKNTMNEQLRKKQKQIDTIQRSHRAEIQKMQTTRKNERLMKNQQINEITKAFEEEMDKLKQMVSVKDKMIQNLSIQNNKEKNRILNLTRDYEAEISHLTHEKSRLIQELQSLGYHNQVLTKDKVLLAGDLQRENNNLRQLLIQSSAQLQRCKNEFMGLAKENTILSTKLRGAEEQAKTWRDSYYMNKTRAY